jgi:ADP-heptose:LPS heptosyltransferase
MQTHFMQAIDQYAGQLLCWVASLFCPKRHAEFPKQIKHVFVIKMLGIGSIVLMGPMIRSLKERFPGAVISFVTFDGHAPIPLLYRYTSTVYSIRKSSIRLFLLDTFKLLYRMRKISPEILIDGEFFSRYTALLTCFSTAKFRVGFYNRNMYRGAFLDHHA